MQEHERVRYVTRNFGDLQGLKSVLTGALFLAMVPMYASGFQWGLVLMVAVLLGVGPLWLVVDRYYELRFGRVRAASGGHPRSRTLIRAAGMAVYVVAVVGEIQLQPTVSLLAIGMALTTLAFWWTERPFKGYYLVVSALLVGVALLPLIGLLPSERSPQFNSGMVFVITGAFLILRGVMDHRWLVRNMKPLPEEEGDGSAV